MLLKVTGIAFLLLQPTGQAQGRGIFLFNKLSQVGQPEQPVQAGSLPCGVQTDQPQDTAAMELSHNAPTFAIWLNKCCTAAPLPAGRHVLHRLRLA